MRQVRIVAVILASIVVLCTTACTSISTSHQEPVTIHTSTPTSTDKIIMIKNSVVETDQINQYMTVEELYPGKSWIVCNLTIVNQGYDKFELQPYQFQLTVDNVRYHPEAMSMNNPLPFVEILNTGQVTGEVVFIVPKDHSQDSSLSFEQYSYQPYNIVWK